MDKKKELIKLLKRTKVYEALKRLNAADRKRRLDLKRQYGEDSLRYIRYLHNYYTNSPTRKELEEEYRRESWNLIQRYGREKADEILDIIEKELE